MIVFSVILNFWYPFGVFLLQLHFTHGIRKIVTPFSLPKIFFQILSCQLKYSKQRSGFTFLRTLGISKPALINFKHWIISFSSSKHLFFQDVQNQCVFACLTCKRSHFHMLDIYWVSDVHELV